MGKENSIEKKIKKNTLGKTIVRNTRDFFAAIRRGAGRVFTAVMSTSAFLVMLNAVANGFWSRQIRLGKVSPLLVAKDAMSTVRVAGIFGLADILLHTPKFIYDRMENRCCPPAGRSLNGDVEESRLLSHGTEEIMQRFNGWTPWLCDVLASLGYTVRNANLPAFVLGYTLLNVYAGMLGQDGSIARTEFLGVEDANWKGYLALSVVGGLGFFNQDFEKSRQERAEKLMNLVLLEKTEFGGNQNLQEFVNKKDYVGWMNRAKDIMEDERQSHVVSAAPIRLEV